MYEPVPSTIKDCGGHYEVPNSVKSNQATSLPCAEYELCDADLTEEVKKYELQHLNSFFKQAKVIWLKGFMHVLCYELSSMKRNNY